MAPVRAIFLVMGFAGVGAAIAIEAASNGGAPDEVVIKTLRDTTAHTAPDSSAATAMELPANTELIWIVQQQYAGFYRAIRINKGPQGWVAASDVEVARHRPGASEPIKACAADMGACPAHGCAAKGDPEAIYQRT